MWYPTYYPLVSNSLGKKSRTILLSVTLFLLLIPCSRKVPCIVGSSINYVRSDGGGVDQLKAFWLMLGAWGPGGLSCKSKYAMMMIIIFVIVIIIIIIIIIIMYYFTGLLQNRSQENQLFRQPKNSIPMSSVQLKSTPSILVLFLKF